MMTTLEIVDAKLHNKVDDITCQLAVEEVEQAIKNYCKIDKVPDELKFVAANMAIDLIRYEQSITGENPEGLEEISIADVSSIKIGDTSITLGKGTENTAVDRSRDSHKPNLDEVVLNYRAQLNAFRRMVW